MSLVVPMEEIIAAENGLLAKHESWVRVELSEVCKILNGFPFKSEKFNRERGIPIIRIRDLTSGAPETMFDGEISSEYLIENGDLLIGMDGNFRCVEWCAGPAGLNQRVCRITPDTRYLDKGFLLYGLNGYLRAIEEVTSKVTVGHLSSIDVLRIPFPLPPLVEQRRIVAKLEAVLTKVNTSRKRLERIATILKRFRQAVLAAACEGRLTEDWRELNAPPEAVSCQDILPNAWRTVAVGEVIEGVKYGTAAKCEYRGEGIGVLRIPNIAEGIIDQSNLKYADLPQKEREGLSLISGDLLMIRSNGSVSLVGKTALVRGQDAGLAYAGYLLRLRPIETVVLPEFLNLSLASFKVRLQIELEARSTSGVNNINSEEAKALSILLPPLSEQVEIVRRVNQFFTLADQVESGYLKAKAQVDRLTQSILAKAFRGELVPQDPKDEPAAALLERIRAGSMDTPTRRRGRPVATSTQVPAPEPVPVAPDRAAETETSYRSEARERVDLGTLDADALMAAFRQVLATQARWDSDEDLLRALAQHFGHQRLGSRTKETLKGHLRAALLRRIALRDPDGTLALGPRTLDAYTRDELVACIPSVLRKGQTLDREDLMRALLHHLGFQRLTDPAQDALKSALNAAIRRGLLEAIGTEQLRRMG